MARLERAESDIAAVKTEVAGSVRVAAFQTASLTLVPDMLIALLARHPRLRVEVIHREAQEALSAVLARDCDLAVGEEYDGHPVSRAGRLDFSPLCMDTMRVAAPENFTVSGGQQAGLAGLADRPWAMEPAGTAARQWAVAMCRDAGFEPDIRFESADVMFHRRLVDQGLAAAFLPDLLRTDGALTGPGRARLSVPAGSSRRYGKERARIQPSSPAAMRWLSARQADRRVLPLHSKGKGLPSLPRNFDRLIDR